jgi:hypothetical protein
MGACFEHDRLVCGEQQPASPAVTLAKGATQQLVRYCKPLSGECQLLEGVYVHYTTQSGLQYRNTATLAMI